MKFHWPSFLLGCGVGAAATLFAKQLRPFVLEAASAVYGLSETFAAQVAVWGEDAEDVLAEARARTRTRRPRKRTRAPK